MEQSKGLLLELLEVKYQFAARDNLSWFFESNHWCQRFQFLFISWELPLSIWNRAY